jgi:hypothetical protein
MTNTTSWVRYYIRPVILAVSAQSRRGFLPKSCPATRFGKIICQSAYSFRPDSESCVRPPNACFVSAKRRSMSAFFATLACTATALPSLVCDFGDDSDSVSARLAGSAVDGHGRVHFAQVLRERMSFFLLDGFEQHRDVAHMFLGPLYDLTDTVFAVEDIDIFNRLLASSNSCTAASLRASSFPLCNLSRSRLGGAMVGPKTGRPAGAAGPAGRGGPLGAALCVAPPVPAPRAGASITTSPALS